MERSFDAVIIGGGAAGLSAALTLGRARRRVLVCDDGKPRNAVADRMHGFITRDGTPPAELLRIAREELRAYPSVEFHEAQITNAEREGDAFNVWEQQGPKLRARTVLLATGVYDALPAIDGVRELWGCGVFVCPYCDGWEVRDKRIAALGKGKRAVELAQELSQWSGDLLVCLEEGTDLTESHRGWLASRGVVERPQCVVAVERDGEGLRIRFAAGEEERAGALFLCVPLRQKYPLVEMLGATVDPDGNIETDAGGRTRAAGVYAAGDCVTDRHQVILAASSGVCAAMAINEDLLAREIQKNI